MAENTYKTHLEKILKQDERLLDDNKEIKGNLLKEFVNHLDEKLIGLLLDDDKSREKFFLRIKDAYVFKANDFKFFIDENAIDNSFTQYTNQIGLASNGKFLKNSSDVVLNFPYKDCVLEGGQSTEEGLDCFYEYDEETGEYIEKQSKRKEIFYNEVIAADELDRLKDPKALKGFRKYTSKGEKTPDELARNSEGIITDNLIIKGNNLLALYSLKKEFKGQVKLIYIDPPYNTGNDSFAYNDNFNHSTWLTFMYNRLEVSRELLRKDGVIFISCDDNEYTYLKTVCDEIYRPERFENIFHIKVRHENRILRKDIRYQKVIEQVLCYSMPNYSPNRIMNEEGEESDNYQFNISINKDAAPIQTSIGKHKVEIYKKEDYQLINSNEGDLKEYNIRGSLITQKGSASEFYEKNLRQRKSSDGLGALYKVMGMGTKGDGLGYRYIRQPFDSKGGNGFYYQGRPLSKSDIKGNPYPNYYDFENAFNRVSKEGGVNFKNGKKPEVFLKKIFEIANVQKGDIILDFHLGSGSSFATAMKLGYQAIGCEQIDEQIELSITRMKNVINGDQTGISNLDDVNWKGGGAFIFCELAKNNENAKDELKACNSLDEIISLVKNFEEKYFLHYNVKFKEFIENTVRETNFQNLKLGKQKEMFCRMLDLNQLYVNVSEMEDKRYGLNKKDIELTKDFYQIKD